MVKIKPICEAESGDFVDHKGKISIISSVEHKGDYSIIILQDDGQSIIVSKDQKTKIFSVKVGR